MNWEGFIDPSLPLPGEPIKGLFGYRRMSHTDYLAFPAVNASLLKCRTAAEMYASLTAEHRDSEALDIGSLCHMAILEPEANWRDRFALADIPINPKTGEAYGKTTKKALAAVEEATEANPGKIIVSADLLGEYLDVCRDLSYAAQANPDAMELLTDCVTEVTGILWHPRWQCWVKWRPDIMPRNCRKLIDVKTTSRHVADFKKDAWQFGYFSQAVWYVECHELMCKVLNLTVPSFIWIILSKADNSRYPRPAMCRTAEAPMNPELCQGIAHAKTSLGIPEGFSKVDMFLACLREHIADGCPTPQDYQRFRELRRIWPAFEQESGERGGRWLLVD